MAGKLGLPDAYDQLWGIIRQGLQLRKVGLPDAYEKSMAPIEKGLPGPGLLAHVAASKYGDHLPLHR